MYLRTQELTSLSTRKTRDPNSEGWRDPRAVSPAVLLFLGSAFAISPTPGNPRARIYFRLLAREKKRGGCCTVWSLTRPLSENVSNKIPGIPPNPHTHEEGSRKIPNTQPEIRIIHTFPRKYQGDHRIPFTYLITVVQDDHARGNKERREFVVSVVVVVVVWISFFFVYNVRS